VEPQGSVTVDIYISAGDDFGFYFPIPNTDVAGPAGLAGYSSATVGVPVIAPTKEDETEKSYIKL